MYFKFFAINNWVSTSLADPNDWSKKWAKSASVERPAPSAIFEDILTTALCNWSHNPFFSNQGNWEVTSYTSVAYMTASCHTLYSRKLRDFPTMLFDNENGNDNGNGNFARIKNLAYG